MAIGDVLKQLGLTLGAVGAQGGQALAGAMQAQGSPLAFEEQQANQRQRQQLAQQLQLHQMMTPFEQGELGLRQKQFAASQQQQQLQNQQLDAQTKAQEDERETKNNQWLTTNLNSGTIMGAQAGDPDAVVIGGHHVKAAPQIMMNVPPELQSVFGTGKLPLNKLTEGPIDKIFGSSLKKKSINTSGFMNQIDTLFPLDAKSAGDISIPQFAPNQPGKPQLAFVNNNPGNLKYVGQDGATQGENGFAKFDNPSAGYAALHRQISVDAGRGLTLGQYITKYAPPIENDTKAYISQASQALNATADTPLADVDPEALASFQAHKESGAAVDPSSGIAINAKHNALYKNQIQSLADNGDETGIRTLMTKLTQADDEWDKKYGPKTQAAEVNLAEKKKFADSRGDYMAATINLPKATTDYIYKQISSGAQTIDTALRNLGLQGTAAKEVAINRWAEENLPMPIPLDTSSRNHLANLESVLDSLKKLKAGINQYQDTTPGKMFFQRLGYKLGLGDENGSGGLISLGEMDRIRGAAQALTGVRTGFNTLEKGEIHTPNFWLDSGRLMNDKVDNMIGYLENQEKNLYKFGAKSGVVQGGPTSDNRPKQRKYIPDPKKPGTLILNPEWKE